MSRDRFPRAPVRVTEAQLPGVASALGAGDSGALVEVADGPSPGLRRWSGTAFGPLIPADQTVQTIAYRTASAAPSTYPPGLSLMQLPGSGALTDGWPADVSTVLTERLSNTRTFQWVVYKDASRVWMRGIPVPATDGASWDAFVEYYGSSGGVPFAKLNATGTRDATTFLRGDGTFAVPPTSGGATTSAGISDFTEAAQDAAAALFTAGTHTGISAVYDDTNGRLNLASTEVSPAGSPTPPAGIWLGNAPFGPLTATAATVAAGTIRLSPFVPASTFTVAELGILTVGTTSGGTNAGRIVVYDSDAQGWPGTLLRTVELTNMATAGGKSGVLASTLQLVAGRRYWLGVHSDFANTLRLVSAQSTQHLGYISSADTATRFTVQRTLAFTSPPPASFSFTSADLNANVPVEVRMRVG